MMNRLWVTGYRSYELGIFSNQDKKIEVVKYALKKYLTSLLENGELDWVITGANLGVDQWVIDVTQDLKKNYPLKNSIIIPYQNFEKRWKPENQTKFNQLKTQVDFFAATSNSPYQNPMQLKNYQTFMLKHTDSSLLIYDLEHPGKPDYDYQVIRLYQENHKYELNLIDFYNLEDSGIELSENLEM